MRDKLIQAMQEYFGTDARRIDHAQQVLDFAEKILSQEGGDAEIVAAAAILHDIGIHEAEKKYGSSAGGYQEIEGPPIAENILKKTSFPRGKINEVLVIIANHHTPGKIQTLNYRILTDADWLVNIKDEIDLKDKDKLAKIINKVIKTPTGQELAKSLYL